MPYRIFDIAEVGRYLHLAMADVERLVQNQDIPFEKRGNRLVFRKVDIDAWASQRILGLESGRLASYHAKTSTDAAAFLPTQALMPELIKSQFINQDLPARTKASVVREMAALAASTNRVNDPKGLVASIEGREELCSTGLPGGLALLHPRYPDPNLIESPFVVVGRTFHGIPFGAPDGRTTDLFFLVGCPDDRLHLHTLARLCMMAQKTDLLSQLREASSAEEMKEAIVQAEEAVLKLSPVR